MYLYSGGEGGRGEGMDSAQPESCHARGDTLSVLCCLVLVGSCLRVSAEEVPILVLVGIRIIATGPRLNGGAFGPVAESGSVFPGHYRCSRKAWPESTERMQRKVDSRVYAVQLP